MTMAFLFFLARTLSLLVVASCYIFQARKERRKALRRGFLLWSAFLLAPTLAFAGQSATANGINVPGGLMIAAVILSILIEVPIALWTVKETYDAHKRQQFFVPEPLRIIAEGREQARVHEQRAAEARARKEKAMEDMMRDLALSPVRAGRGR